ncbi:hypothetical protein C2845_PM01G39740 [Panicum miliaceum]|uniref:Uncharacterized protein n=1 Tax=Panicum miliaceum TaxID=4540 RepID=A0A3L6TIS6_PANMI|nr:hypothetical protein C2845_PM01G39740 [Panicum miliaceum]
MKKLSFQESQEPALRKSENPQTTRGGRDTKIARSTTQEWKCSLLKPFLVSDAAVQSALSQNKLYQSNGISFFLEESNGISYRSESKRPGKPGFKGDCARTSQNAMPSSAEFLGCLELEAGAVGRRVLGGLGSVEVQDPFHSEAHV